MFVDADGIVLEGPVTNIWWREGDVLVTPSLELGILAGETRAALLELARGTGWVVEEGVYPLARLAAADEAFTSSSVREVVPVVELDGRPFERGPAADDLQRALRAVARRLIVGAAASIDPAAAASTVSVVRAVDDHVR